jgi:ribonucleoside-diphosphate reductase beta chain
MNALMLLNDSAYDRELHKVSIVMSLFALNILEAVLFKSSFLTSFAFKENGLFSVTADIIAKIALDEAGHYAMTTTLINRLRKDPDWAYIFHNYSATINQLYADAIEADFDWIDYCYPEDTRLLGVNNAVLKQYVTYNLHSVMTSVGQPPIVDKVPNPCIWANKYTRPSNVQTAQKEKTSGNYLLGIVDTHIPTDFWENLS